MQGILPNLEIFNFETVKLSSKNTRFVSPDSPIQTNRYPAQSKYFIEFLDSDVTLEMVEIPGGTFTMGAPESEHKSSDDERPQHQVTIKPFFMGKYPVTQKQWKQVATSIPKVDRYLNPKPSHFKGDNLPVEQVSWYEAVEFCARLSKKTHRNYRLPSEAEWEYACRAGSTTPFYFGELITSEVANYNGSYIYSHEPRGKFRQQTTPVGSFPPNAFGLCDMHGNVWEWCADTWHDNYEGAPTDGSAWIDDVNGWVDNEYNNSCRVLRGGSWNPYPVSCRSAYRNRYLSGSRYDENGFRVVCSGTFLINANHVGIESTDMSF